MSRSSSAAILLRRTAAARLRGDQGGGWAVLLLVISARCGLGRVAGGAWSLLVRGAGRGAVWWARPCQVEGAGRGPEGGGRLLDPLPRSRPRPVGPVAAWRGGVQVVRFPRGAGPLRSKSAGPVGRARPCLAGRAMHSPTGGTGPVPLSLSAPWSCCHSNGGLLPSH